MSIAIDHNYLLRIAYYSTSHYPQEALTAELFNTTFGSMIELAEYNIILFNQGVSNIGITSRMESSFFLTNATHITAEQVGLIIRIAGKLNCSSSG